MGFTDDSSAVALSASADVALVVIAVITVIVTIWIFRAQLRAQKPLVKIDVLYYAKAKSRVPDPLHLEFGLSEFTTALGEADSAYRKYAPDYHLTPFLRAVITNTGGIAVAVESVGFQNVAEAGRNYTHPENPTLPYDLAPHRRILWKELYSELEHWAGPRRKIRFVATLSDGDSTYSKWVKLYPRPNVPARTPPAPGGAAAPRMHS